MTPSHSLEDIPAGWGLGPTNQNLLPQFAKAISPLLPNAGPRPPAIDEEGESQPGDPDSPTKTHPGGVGEFLQGLFDSQFVGEGTKMVGGGEFDSDATPRVRAGFSCFPVPDYGPDFQLDPDEPVLRHPMPRSRADSGDGIDVNT
jgi:hypothetical protein